MFTAHHIGSTTLFGVFPEGATFLGGSFLENREPRVGFSDVFPDQGDDLFDVFEEGDMINSRSDDLRLNRTGDVLVILHDLLGEGLKFLPNLLNLLFDLFVFGGVNLLPFFEPSLVKLGNTLFFDFFLAIKFGERIGTKGRFKTIPHRGSLIVLQSLEEVVDLGKGRFWARAGFSIA